ncbi:MAG: SDR family oxidoreductase [Acidobacteria bacterium]|nr:SDR family oxidoreductase [Acidobacteriota bacterium]
MLIAGCGYVGAALARQLAGHGHEVFGLRRSSGKETPGVRWVSADLARRETLADLPVDLDHVFYSAAADGSTEEAYHRAYVQGARNLLTALEAQGTSPKRVFFTSSTGVYGQSGGEWVDETSPTEPPRATGRILLEAEAVFHAGPFPATVLRLAGIYGPGRTRLIDQVRHGEAYLPSGPPLYTNRIHRDDCAGALAHLMELQDPAAVYLGVDHEPVLKSDVQAWIATRLDLPPLPEPPTGVTPAGKRCRNARLVESGYTFLYPSFREGYGEILG